MVTPAGCGMDRLPEELLVNVVSLTSPIDACRAAVFSRAFRAAADSDAVWSSFLPRNLPQFAKGEVPRRPMSKKELFRRLSGQPALLPHKIMGMQLDRATSAEVLTLSSRALQIPEDDRRWRRWVRVVSGSNYSKRDKRLFFSEAAQLGSGSHLELRARIQRKILSQNATYTVYMVFKIDLPFYVHGFPYQEASVGIAGRESTRQVCLQGYVKNGDEAGDQPQKHILKLFSRRYGIPNPGDDNVYFPRKRADGWMELELGEFQNIEGDAGEEVSTSLIQTTHT